MSQFLQNAWYVAAWDDEVGASPLGRTLLNERVALYRDADGTLAAIGNVCPHRFALLSMGRVVDGKIECGYHGLRFDRTGACVFNPHGNGAIPAAARVKSYPVEMRYGAIWIWMGDPALANPDAIPLYPHLADPRYRTLRGSTHLAARFDLIVDNLMDPSHGQFVHASFSKGVVFSNVQPELEQDGDTVRLKLFFPNSGAPKQMAEFVADGLDLVDFRSEFTWNAPSVLQNRTSVAAPGTDPALAPHKVASHFITPETDSSSHYFYAHSRNVKVDDVSLDEATLDWQTVAFSQQDKPVIEACQQIVGDTAMAAMKPVMLMCDIGVNRWRRIFDRMVGEEQDRLLAAA